VRPHNEDYIGHWEPTGPEQTRSHGWLFALADGVGGQDLGEVASRTAIETAVEGFPKAKAGEPHAAVLTRLVQSANANVYEAGRAASPGGVPMATTIVLCALRFDRAVVAHVGDSRCYVIRRGHIDALTRDHTVVNEQIRLGVISTKEGARASTKHLLTRSLGNDLFVSVDVGEHAVFPGDVLLLCSDGLHGVVEAPEIVRAVARHRELDDAARCLVDLAARKDGSDNCSVQLIRVRATERIGMYRGRPYKLR
jgi:serine/threonine protein phosphatase PrpC